MLVLYPFDKPTFSVLFGSVLLLASTPPYGARIMDHEKEANTPDSERYP